jgi:hypothetical protein
VTQRYDHRQHEPNARAHGGPPVEERVKNIILLKAPKEHTEKRAPFRYAEDISLCLTGKAVVGMVETQGEGDGQKTEDQPHAKQTAHAPQPPMRSTNAEPNPVPIASDAERPVPDARRNVAGGS